MIPGPARLALLRLRTPTRVWRWPLPFRPLSVHGV